MLSPNEYEYLQTLDELSDELELELIKYDENRFNTDFDKIFGEDNDLN